MVGVSRKWARRDSTGEPEKPEARKLPENAHAAKWQSHLPVARRAASPRVLFPSGVMFGTDAFTLGDTTDFASDRH